MRSLLLVVAIVVTAVGLTGCGSACPGCVNPAIIFRVKDATAHLRTDAAVSVDGTAADPVVNRECGDGIECTHRFFGSETGSAKVKVVLTEHRTSEFEVFLQDRKDGCGLETMEVDVAMVVAGAAASTPSTEKSALSSCGGE